MTAPAILVVRLGALGDVILTLPAVRLLRRSLPEARIVWLVEAPHASLLNGNPDLDEVLPIDTRAWRRAPGLGTVRGMGHLVAALRARRFDVALDLQGLWKSAVWALASGAALRVGLPALRMREATSGLLLNHRAEEPSGLAHASALYLETARVAVRALGREPAPGATDSDPLIHLDASERGWAEGVLGHHGLGPFAVLNPGAAWSSKRWPRDRFPLLARRLVAEFGLGVFVAHGPGEEHLARAVVDGAGSRQVVTFATSVRELASLLGRARLFVGGDTGPYHLARAMGTPTVGLFGPTDPGRNGPWPAFDPVLWGRVPCSPCYRRTCPIKLPCMGSIAVDQVLEGVLTALAGAPRENEKPPTVRPVSATGRGVSALRVKMN